MRVWQQIREKKMNYQRNLNGSGNGGTYSMIQEFEPDVTVLNGSAISQNDMDKNLSGGESLFE